MDRFSIPYLVRLVTYVLDYEFDGVVSGTPTWELFIGGDSAGPAADGVGIAGNLWRFAITPDIDATVGASARIRLTATVDSSPVIVDIYSGIADTVNLVETGKSYRHTQDALDETAKTADVTITEVPT